jgi:hypothetical protein
MNVLRQSYTFEVAATLAAPALLCDTAKRIFCAAGNFDLAFTLIVIINGLRKLE